MNTYLITGGAGFIGSTLSERLIKEGNKGIVLGYGDDITRILNIANENNLDITIVNARCIKPLDNNMLNNIFKMDLPIMVFEQVVSSGTLYDKVLEFKEENDYKSKVYKHNFDANTIIPHGKKKDVYKAYGLSDEEILNWINKKIN